MENNNNISENIYNTQIKEFNNKDEKLSQNVVNFDLKNYNQVCNYCHIRTFIRATHCLVCDECILFKQEHCQYIANCIGFNNIQYFITQLSLYSFPFPFLFPFKYSPSNINLLFFLFSFFFLCFLCSFSNFTTSIRFSSIYFSNYTYCYCHFHISYCKST